jgi:tryptophan-rich sensory protein
MNTDGTPVTDKVEATLDAPHIAQATATRQPRNLPVHIAFIIVLAAILALKYYLYFQSPETGDGLSVKRVGATLSHLLIWAFSYTMCVYASRKLLLGILAGVTLFFGVLVMPILGWIGVVVMYVVYKRSARA